MSLISKNMHFNVVFCSEKSLVPWKHLLNVSLDNTLPKMTFSERMMIGRNGHFTHNYAAWDVHASWLIYEKVAKVAPLDRVEHSSLAGTCVALLVR